LSRADAKRLACKRQFVTGAAKSVNSLVHVALPKLINAVQLTRSVEEKPLVVAFRFHLYEWKQGKESVLSKICCPWSVVSHQLSGWFP
jgi:hypothetical protein